MLHVYSGHNDSIYVNGSTALVNAWPQIVTYDTRIVAEKGSPIHLFGKNMICLMFVIFVILLNRFDKRFSSYGMTKR